MSEYKAGDIIDGNIKVLKNGAGYDLARGRISKAPGTYMDDPNRITSVRGSELGSLSHAARQDKMEARLLKEISAIDPDMPGKAVPADAWAAVVGRQAASGWTADGRASTAAADFARKALGYTVEKATKLQVNVQVNVVPDAMGDDEW